MAPTYRVLTGPTAAGKTNWLLKRAKTRPMLIISADSRQVLRKMNIGTGKPSPSTRKLLPHRGVDCADPGELFSAFHFLAAAASGLREAEQAGLEPWVCGGTGLYIRALVEGLDLGLPPRPQLRRALESMLMKSEAAKLAEALGLKLGDSENPVRVIRAAEAACKDQDAARRIYSLVSLDPDLAADDRPQGSGAVPGGDPTGGTEAAATQELKRWQCLGIYVLDPGREALSRRIEQRVRKMFEAGLVKEVAGLRADGFGEATVVREGIGYREAGQVLDGALSLMEAIERTIIRTRQYAKRQRTYFRGRGWRVYTLEELNGLFAGD